MSDHDSNGGDFRRRGQGSMRENILARSLVERLERFELERGGGNRKEARRRVARQVGVGPATIENIWRGRVKDPRSSLLSKLVAAVINATQRQIQFLEHELQVARRIGLPPGDDVIIEVETHIARAKARLADLGGGQS